MRRLFSRLFSPQPQAGAFDATRTSLKTADWETDSYGPNSALAELGTARARSQDAVRNNPWIRRAVGLYVSHLIGCGISPRPKLEDAALRADMLALWEDWSGEADADGVLPLASLQSQWARGRLESGEVFIRFLSLPRSADSVVPLRLQTLEADFLPMQTVLRTGDTALSYGMERDASGKRLAYWFYPQHPRDHYLLARPNDLRRVDAADVLHHYAPSRPGQCRGEPGTLSSLVRARNIDHYESAEITRKKLKARFVGAVYKENIEENPFNGTTNAYLDSLKAQLTAAINANDAALIADLQAQVAAEQEKRSIVDIEDGYMLQLALNEKIEIPGADIGDGGLEFLRFQLRSVAAGIGVPYEHLTGDYSGANDRIMRVVLNTFYRELEANQDLLIAQVLQPIWCRFLTAAVLSGRLNLPGYFDHPRRWQACEWRAHAWSYVNPLQEAQTAVLRIQNGLTSRSAAVAESGWDAEEIDRQQAADQAREEKLGLDYSASSTTQDKPIP